MVFKNIIVLISFITTISAIGQPYSLPNEELIYSFDTQNGKKVSLCKDKGNKYLVYRFGTESKIEFEFPGRSEDSWKKFKYSFWLRGGGVANEGIDLNYIYFINNNYKYIIYDTYFAVGNKQDIGVRIINLKTNKVTNIKGKTKTQKGTLVDFRDNNLLEFGDELFD
jgi:hypothetical protein